MELTAMEIKILLMLLEREEHTQGLFPTEEKIKNKLQDRYRELGGYVKEN